AVFGDVVLRRGLARAWGRTKWTSAVAREHRLLLIGRGEKISGGQTAWGGTAKSKGCFGRERIEVELRVAADCQCGQCGRCCDVGCVTLPREEC
ncbi:MAG: hypothetical protein R3F19_10965, partial [Verrucomicrobiales bacterium]|nr:hypothetical protein [Verrucomicrobiae bacterium]